MVKQHETLRYKKYHKKLQKIYKMDFRGKKVYRPCLGVYCLGEQMFWSYGGARLCARCSEAIKGVLDYEPHHVHFGR